MKQAERYHLIALWKIWDVVDEARGSQERAPYALYLDACEDLSAGKYNIIKAIAADDNLLRGGFRRS